MVPFPCTTRDTVPVASAFFWAAITPSDASYITVPTAVAGAVAEVSSLKVIAVPSAILPDSTVSDDAAVALEAKRTDDRFRLEAG